MPIELYLSYFFASCTVMAAAAMKAVNRLGGSFPIGAGLPAAAIRRTA